MDSLVRRRELIAIVLLVATVLRLVILVIANLLGSSYAGGVLLSVAAVAAALWCLRSPATANARPLLLLAVVAAASSVVVEFGLSVYNVVDGAEFGISYLFAFLPDLVLPIVAVIMGIAGLRDPAHHLPSVPAPTPLPVQAPQVPVEQQPTWQPDQAAGAAWTTAGEAASRAPAAGWGAPEGSGPAGSWQPIPGSRPDPEQWRRPGV